LTTVAENNTPQTPRPHSHFATWLHVVTTRARFDARWLAVAGAMTVAATVFFGWRAILSIMLATLGALVMHYAIARIVRLIQRRYETDPFAHVLMLGAMTALCLPVFTDWLIPFLAGASVGALTHVVGRSHRVRLHAVALVVLAVWFAPAMLRGHGPSEAARTQFEWYHNVLNPSRVITGDLAVSHEPLSRQLWMQQITSPSNEPAIRMGDTERLILRERFRMIEHEWVMVNILSSGELSRLEDVLIGAVPGPVGGTSRALLLALMLYLIYRRLSRWSVPLYAFISAAGTLMVMMAVLSDRDMLVIARLVQIRPAIGVTYVTYMLLGTPLLLIFGILAPMTMPITRWGRMIYGTLLGAFAVAAMWVTGVPAAAFFALVLVSLISRPLDRLRFGRFAA
jgi:Na+-translocating ferredoxin:NAD+ oxidoreductase RnfD subunit